MSTPSNMTNFAVNSYNLEAPGNSWCVKPGSIYTNKQANFGYFNNKCGDPYTYYSFWYRRFPDQTKYLNCYNIPYVDPLLKNTYGYVNGSKKCTTPVHNNRYTGTYGGFKYFG